jgi:hypothetical protein
MNIGLWRHDLMMCEAVSGTVNTHDIAIAFGGDSEEGSGFGFGEGNPIISATVHDFCGYNQMTFWHRTDELFEPRSWLSSPEGRSFSISIQKQPRSGKRCCCASGDPTRN